MPTGIIIIAIAALLIGIMGGDGVVDRRVDGIEERVVELEVRADLAGHTIPREMFYFSQPDTGAAPDTVLVDVPPPPASWTTFGPSVIAVPPTQKGGE